MPREQLYQDDLRDQWQSFAHEQEWHRLVKYALDFSEQSQTAVTFLSGEIHLGAFGCLERGPTKMFQLISSGVVHPAPPALMAQTFNWMARRPRPLTDDIHVRMLDLPHIHSRYLAARNWLSIEHLPNNSLDVQWHVEEMTEAIQVTIRGPAC
jgi:hypothetical protein